MTNKYITNPGLGRNVSRKKISERQGFRMGFLECITVSMVTIPYLTTRAAGEYHFYSFLLGLLLVAIYGWAIFILATRFPEGYVQAIDVHMGMCGKLVEIMYILRYSLRTGLLLLFFGAMVQQYLMPSFSLWGLIIVFMLLCGYGASRQMEARGRLMELLFWWMLVPLILLVVFSVSSMDFRELGNMSVTSSGNLGGVLQGAYGVLLSLSPLELALYNVPAQKRNQKRGFARLIVWILVALLLAYCFILGILGEGWVKSRPDASLSVMEAAAFPGGAVARFDYPVMAFWIIGVFAVVSGFLQHSKEHAGKLFGVKTQKGRRLCVVLVMGLSLGSIFLYLLPEVGSRIMAYLMYGDLFLSLLLPGVVWCVKYVGMRHSLVRTLGKCSVVLACLLVGVFLGVTEGSESRFLSLASNSVAGHDTEGINIEKMSRSQRSLEKRDYVLELDVEDTGERDKLYAFTFSLAELGDYQGENSMEKRVCRIEATCLEDAMDQYAKTYERQLDMAHVTHMGCFVTGEPLRHLLLEMSEMPSIPKSIEVELSDNKLILRDMIKATYGREDL